MMRADRNWLIGLVIGVGILAIVYWKQQEGFEDTPQPELKLFTIPHTITRKKNLATKVNNVPLVIYETWRTRDVPEGMKNAIYSLIEKNPEFDYSLYSDEECLDFISSEFDEDVLNAYKTLKPAAFKADLWRYCILYKKGGVYMDSKYMSEVPLLSIVKEYSEVYVRDQQPGGICEEAMYNGFIISPPGNEIFQQCIKEIVIAIQNRAYNRNVLDVTGPCLFGRVIQKYKTSEFIETNPFQYDDRFGPGIKMNGVLILKHYPTYRDEQRRSSALPHYGELYKQQNIYN